jgi:hypothetical protein
MPKIKDVNHFIKIPGSEYLKAKFGSTPADAFFTVV